MMKNELIKKFAEQSGLPTALDYHQKRYEKFAELIIRECANLDFRVLTGQVTSDGMQAIEECILDHFGVEE